MPAGLREERVLLVFELFGVFLVQIEEILSQVAAVELLALVAPLAHLLGLERRRPHVAEFADEVESDLCFTAESLGSVQFELPTLGKSEIKGSFDNLVAVVAKVIVQLVEGVQASEARYFELSKTKLSLKTLLIKLLSVSFLRVGLLRRYRRRRICRI